MQDVESGPSTTVIRFLMKNYSDVFFFFLSLVEVSITFVLLIFSFRAPIPV